MIILLPLPPIDAQVNKLLPLGFSKKVIRRELFLSNGNLDTAASRLLDRQQRQRDEEEDGEKEEGCPGAFDEGGWEEEVDAESSEEGMETQREKKTTFSVNSIEVSDSW